MNDLEVNLIWIPLFPLLGAVFNLLFGRALLEARWGERFGKEIVHMVAVAAVATLVFDRRFVPKGRKYRDDAEE